MTMLTPESAGTAVRHDRDHGLRVRQGPADVDAPGSGAGTRLGTAREDAQWPRLPPLVVPRACRPPPVPPAVFFRESHVPGRRYHRHPGGHRRRHVRDPRHRHKNARMGYQNCYPICGGNHEPVLIRSSKFPRHLRWRPIRAGESSRYRGVQVVREFGMMVLQPTQRRPNPTCDRLTCSLRVIAESAAAAVKADGGA